MSIEVKMLPPWIAYPDIPRGSVGWRMGGADGYIYEWLQYVNEFGRDNYMKMFPAPKEWEIIYY